MTTRLQPTHELHERRRSRNVGVAVSLLVLIGVIFFLTVVKVNRGDNMEAFDHVVRPGLEPGAEAGQ